MSNSQKIVLAIVSGLFLLLYLGFDTKPSTQKKIDEIRSLNATSTDINSLLLNARKNLRPEDAKGILVAESLLSEAKNTTDKTEAFKELSKAWYQVKQFALAGYYAKQVAENEDTADAWAIAGATFNTGMNRETKDNVKEYCKSEAIQSFENAISLNPDNVTYRANLAICYVERPAEDQPMEGIQQLLKLNKKHPDNVFVLYTLGRLGVQTSQFEKAKARLEKANKLEPDNIKVNCLLAQVYQKLGELDKAKTFQDICTSFGKTKR